MLLQVRQRESILVGADQVRPLKAEFSLASDRKESLRDMLPPTQRKASILVRNHLQGPLGGDMRGSQDLSVAPGDGQLQLH